MDVLNEKELLMDQVCERDPGRVLGLDILLESWGLSGLEMMYHLLYVFLTNDDLRCLVRCLGHHSALVLLLLDCYPSFQNPNSRHHLVLLIGL